MGRAARIVTDKNRCFIIRLIGAMAKQMKLMEYLEGLATRCRVGGCASGHVQNLRFVSITL